MRKPQCRVDSAVGGAIFLRRAGFAPGCARYSGGVSEPRDLPVCIIGDSFVAGYGDETGRGWTALLVDEGARVGLSLHTVVAGIGGDTSEMILDRWDEVDRRRAAFPTTAVIAEFGHTRHRA